MPEKRLSSPLSRIFTEYRSNVNEATHTKKAAVNRSTARSMLCVSHVTSC